MSESILYHFDGWQSCHETRALRDGQEYTVAFGHDPRQGYWVRVAAKDQTFISLMTQSTPEMVIDVLHSYNVQLVRFYNEFLAQLFPQGLYNQERWEPELSYE